VACTRCIQPTMEHAAFPTVQYHHLPAARRQVCTQLAKGPLLAIVAGACLLPRIRWELPQAVTHRPRPGSYLRQHEFVHTQGIARRASRNVASPNILYVVPPVNAHCARVGTQSSSSQPVLAHLIGLATGATGLDVSSDHSSRRACSSRRLGLTSASAPASV
jgi:hypothetical protein